MRRLIKYIYELPDWPQFYWDEKRITPLLSSVRHRQGRILGKMEALGFPLQAEATLHSLTIEVVKSGEIEGESLNADQVRSSIARKLGIKIAGLIPADRPIDGVVEMMLDATQHYSEPLTAKRLFAWHAAMFPTGTSGMHKIVVGKWRNNAKDDPMQVVSGALGKEKVHFRAPDADVLKDEMRTFMDWFNTEKNIDPVIKAALAHVWFVTIHPFDDGNGRIARAIADMQLARADASPQRFYSMSAQIRKERNEYYDTLEQTQKGTMDITKWMEWFLHCFDRALMATDETLAVVLNKAKFWEKYAKTVFNNRQVLLLNKLLDGFVGKLTTSKWAKIAKCSQDTALRDIQDLVTRKILKKETAGGRSTSYGLMPG
ncbi:MAG TPA: Fic family protein [Chitinophagaceae bacterium]